MKMKDHVPEYRKYESLFIADLKECSMQLLMLLQKDLRFIKQIEVKKGKEQITAVDGRLFNVPKGFIKYILPILTDVDNTDNDSYVPDIDNLEVGKIFYIKLKEFNIGSSLLETYQYKINSAIVKKSCNNCEYQSRFYLNNKCTGNCVELNGKNTWQDWKLKENK